MEPDAITLPMTVTEESLLAAGFIRAGDNLRLARLVLAFDAARKRDDRTGRGEAYRAMVAAAASIAAAPSR